MTTVNKGHDHVKPLTGNCNTTGRGADLRLCLLTGQAVRPELAMKAGFSAPFPHKCLGRAGLPTVPPGFAAVCPSVRAAAASIAVLRPDTALLGPEPCRKTLAAPSALFSRAPELWHPKTPPAASLHLGSEAEELQGSVAACLSVTECKNRPHIKPSWHRHPSAFNCCWVAKGRNYTLTATGTS